MIGGVIKRIDECTSLHQFLVNLLVQCQHRRLVVVTALNAGLVIDCRH